MTLTGKRTKTDLYWLGLLALFAVVPLTPWFIRSTFTQHVMIQVLPEQHPKLNILGGYCGQAPFGHSVLLRHRRYGTAMA